MYVAWRDLRFAKGRFALMGTVVVLITVLVGLLSGLTAGLGRENTSAVTGLPADHVAFAAPADGQDVSFTDSTVTEPTWRGWSRVAGVERAEPLGITTTRAEADGRTASVSAFGVLPGSPLAPSGNEVAEGAVVLSTVAADDLAVRQGDQVTLAGRSLTVAAVDGDASYSHTPVVWTSLVDWQHLTAGRGAPEAPYATVVALTTDGSVDVAAADGRLATRTVARDDALTAIGSFSSENGSLQLMRGFLFAISALVVGAFFTVWTIQRAGDVAVLKALGASTGYLLRDALGQAVLLLLLGTAAGTGVAVGAGAALGDRVPFVLDAPTMLVPAAVMVALGVVGAALSVRRITAVDPLTALGSVR